MILSVIRIWLQKSWIGGQNTLHLLVKYQSVVISSSKTIQLFRYYLCNLCDSVTQQMKLQLMKLNII